MRLGGDCEHREVGGGLSTPSTLVWSLGDDDVADAIGCGLVVRARVRDGARHVNKVVELGVTVDMAAREADNAEDGPQLQSVAPSELGIAVVFASVTGSARLTTGDSILQAVPPESEGEEFRSRRRHGSVHGSAIDFARSVLRGWLLHLNGSSFATSLSVNGTSLQSEPQGPDEPQAEPQENPPEDPPEEG